MRWKSAYLRGLDVLAGSGNVSIIGDGAAIRSITIGQNVANTDRVTINGELFVNEDLSINSPLVTINDDTRIAGNLVPSASGKSLGSSGSRWTNAHITTLSVYGNASVSADLSVDGSVKTNLKPYAETETLGTTGIGAKRWANAYLKNLDVLANANVSIVGDNTAARTITLGQSSTFTDLISFGGKISSNLVPNAETETLGSGGVGGKRWYNAYLKGADVLGNATFSGSVSLVAQSTGDKMSLKAHASQASQIFEVLDSSNNVKVVIDENFWFGIGTDNPLYPLQVRRGASGSPPNPADSDVACFYHTANYASNATIRIGSGANGFAGLELGNAAVFQRAGFVYDNNADILSIFSAGDIHINSSLGAIDTIISGDTVENLLFVDGSADRIGISTSAPNAMLDVRGDAIFNEGGEDKDFRIETDGLDAAFFVDGGTNKVHLD